MEKSRHRLNESWFLWISWGLLSCLRRNMSHCYLQLWKKLNYKTETTGWFIVSCFDLFAMMGNWQRGSLLITAFWFDTSTFTDLVSTNRDIPPRWTVTFPRNQPWHSPQTNPRPLIINLYLIISIQHRCIQEKSSIKLKPSTALFFHHFINVTLLLLFIFSLVTSKIEVSRRWVDIRSDLRNEINLHVLSVSTRFVWRKKRKIERDWGCGELAEGSDLIMKATCWHFWFVLKAFWD